ncbi:tumor necrosis factor receptor superfamily member 1B-like [Anguilla rostrata]|uniref:tumor necrosis factor receptor superfamily member 1B-like n=1 Tax=Anguilla rostrata TaxID=7938 RepID=UPI0030CD90EE
MEFRRSICFSLTLLYLFNLVDFVWSRRCPNPPECKLGIISKECKCVSCPSGKYHVVRSGNPRCEFCTQQCTAERHLIQIKDCTANSNRECHCDRGYFCESSAQYTCRRCTLCPDGTFTATTSRLQSCKQHTDCGSLGKVLISTGNRTHDHVCASVTTSSIPRALRVVQNAMEQNYVVKETTVPPSTASTKTFAHETETVINMRAAQTATRYHTKRAIIGTGPKMSPRGLSAHSMFSRCTFSL